MLGKHSTTELSLAPKLRFEFLLGDYLVSSETQVGEKRKETAKQLRSLFCDCETPLGPAVRVFIFLSSQSAYYVTQTPCHFLQKTLPLAVPVHS